ncbi:conserved hypothetical protein [Paraburkholderia piptadeniae]|uniref:PROLIN-rich signal peptide protein n=1 Tax=Paraburkholderia piptadeniae TaxID=1701573 RepID=A0A1N7RYV5_9BURK|nr:DUF3108 domain-containing protein [Paraburkholderia piptadeniae]SIT39885.1 conserved hypothetical protein [Paraburkholderia piptadeniae]
MSSPFAVRTVSHVQLSAAQRRSSRLRWAGVLAAVAGAHLIAALWFERHHETFKPVAPEHVPVQVALLKPERIETQAAGSPPPAVAKPAAPKHGAQKPREHALTATRPRPSEAPATNEAASAPVDTSAASDSAVASSAAARPAANSGPGIGQGNAPQATPGVKFSVPPSGDLQYDTFYNGVRNQPGTIHWTSDGHSYDMVVSVPLPFVGTFSYSSHGHVDAFGLAPDQYVEKRGRRGEDVTTFNHDTKQIGFTRTPDTLALPDGAQDRFSMVMQLASLVRGDPDAYQPGVTRQFYVTDNDSGEIWPIETIGDETVRTGQGSIDARHFMRLPRRENDRRRIDVWLAPSLGWLPARLVQTEPNGTQIELVWRGKLAPPDVNDTSSSSSDDTSPDSAQPSVTDPGAGPEKP